MRQAILLGAELHRDRFELLPQAVDHRTFALIWSGSRPMLASFFARSCSSSSASRSWLALQLLAEHLRRVLRPLRLGLRVLFDEHVASRLAMRCARSGLGRRSRAGSSRCPSRVAAAADRLVDVDDGLATGAQPGRVLDRLARVQLLLADDPLEHLPAQQLLRDGALPLFAVERADAAQQLRRQRRRGDADLRLRQVLRGPERREQRRRPRRRPAAGTIEPPLAAADAPTGSRAGETTVLPSPNPHGLRDDDLHPDTVAVDFARR